MFYRFVLRILDILMRPLARSPECARVKRNTQEMSMVYDESEIEPDEHICAMISEWAEFRITQLVENSKTKDAIALEQEFDEWLTYDGKTDLEYLSITQIG